ncbi:EcsC family protein [Micrococcus luteus]|uniref:EcsC family protein n=1 Tax=Micrococcus luteus TaxID=1270 RepID=UPI0015D80587|nr:EcsC family protein [Micrococcus luteus]
MNESQDGGTDLPGEEDAGPMARQLNQLIDKVIRDGVGPLTGAIAWADERLARAQAKLPGEEAGPDDTTFSDRAVERAVRRLIRESVQAAGMTGFVTSLGGFVTMPVTIPANMAGSLVINARLAAAIAHLRGYDPMDSHVRTVVTMVAIGSSAQQIARAAGVQIGERAAMAAIQRIPIQVLRQINKKAGFYLVAKYGTQRPILTLAKGVPLVGGVVGGSMDATMTGLVGRAANRMFSDEAKD